MLSYPKRIILGLFGLMIAIFLVLGVLTYLENTSDSWPMPPMAVPTAGNAPEQELYDCVIIEEADVDEYLFSKPLSLQFRQWGLSFKIELTVSIDG